jgi:hypothetical protein
MSSVSPYTKDPLAAAALEDPEDIWESIRPTISDDD